MFHYIGYIGECEVVFLPPASEGWVPTFQLTGGGGANGWGYLSSSWKEEGTCLPADPGGGVPTFQLTGVPILDSLGRYPPPRQCSTASSCYAAGDMPLAFTLEDFLAK